MVIHLTIDDKLVREAQQLGQHESEVAAVVAALEEYVRYQKQLQIIDLFGVIEYDAEYDYKSQRQQI
ncbi:MAG TPA: type II toxin-antitoxin system VapB family antitoxin [Anaerolineae bacterium]|nr:type II toxin-antitoxin system VapB family antitoxin [Anaerolineae bacterium]